MVLAEHTSTGNLSNQDADHPLTAPKISNTNPFTKHHLGNLISCQSPSQTQNHSSTNPHQISKSLSSQDTTCSLPTKPLLRPLQILLLKSGSCQPMAIHRMARIQQDVHSWTLMVLIPPDSLSAEIYLPPRPSERLLSSGQDIPRMTSSTFFFAGIGWICCVDRDYGENFRGDCRFNCASSQLWGFICELVFPFHVFVKFSLLSYLGFWFEGYWTDVNIITLQVCRFEHGVTSTLAESDSSWTCGVLVFSALDYDLSTSLLVHIS